MIRLVCIDVDGTLVGSSGEVHANVWPAAARARDAGVRLALCTGRPALGITRHYAARLDPDGWHGFQNGASVVHLPSGRSRSAPLSDDAVARLVARARATGRELELYGDGEYVFERVSDRSRAHAALLGVPFDPRPFESLAAPVVRAQWLLSPDDAMFVQGERTPELEVAPSTSPVMPDTLFVSLTRAGVNKATAVRLLAAEHDVPLDQVMFVGDGWNDTEAMKIVGHPVAMANAEPEAREVARLTVGHVDDGGLVKALEIAAARAGKRR